MVFEFTSAVSIISTTSGQLFVGSLLIILLFICLFLFLVIKNSRSNLIHIDLFLMKYTRRFQLWPDEWRQSNDPTFLFLFGLVQFSSLPQLTTNFQFPFLLIILFYLFIFFMNKYEFPCFIVFFFFFFFCFGCFVTLPVVVVIYKGAVPPNSDGRSVGLHRHIRAKTPRAALLGLFSEPTADSDITVPSLVLSQF